MQVEKPQNHNVCVNGDCPEGIEIIKKIGLTPQEKRAIFFSIKSRIFAMKFRRQKALR